MKKIIKSLVNSIGYEISKKADANPIECSSAEYDMEQEANAEIRVIENYTMLTHARLVTLYQQVTYCEKHKIQGGFVECGTWRGGAVGLMALGNMQYSTNRRHLHLFDSFDSIPEPDASVDGNRAVEEARAVGGGAEGKLIPLNGIYAAVGTPDLEVNKALLEDTIGYDPKFLHYHKGWFQDTVPRDAEMIGEIAILRLDGDWHASTKVCLDHLYDQVVSGGFVIIDDYGYYEGCKIAVDEFMGHRNIRAYLNHIDSTGRYWIKP